MNRRSSERSPCSRKLPSRGSPKKAELTTCSALAQSAGSPRAERAGNFWLSACGGEVHRIAAADLNNSGDKTSDVLVAGLLDKNGLPNNEGLAFDFDGNLRSERNIREKLCQLLGCFLVAV